MGICEHEFYWYDQPATKTSKKIREPESCPSCGVVFSPQNLLNIAYRSKNKKTKRFVSVFACNACAAPLLAYYLPDKDKPTPIDIIPRPMPEDDVSERVKRFSPRFAEIYKQAMISETYNLDELTGVGYRKALEFLVKDFLISKEPNEREKIEGMPLGTCISQRIQNQKIKELSQRAAWLGNDFTHYKRKFDECEISDLRILIKAIAAWVDLELITDEAIQEARPRHFLLDQGDPV